MIDSDGYRPNVGIILTNGEGRLFWARRLGQDSWQFPQGGIRPHETPEQALYRELHEEIGLLPADVEIVASTRGWLRYKLPKRFVRQHCKPVCIGQKQRWFMLRLVGDTSHVRFDLSDRPEFEEWRWIDYWDPIEQIVFFKRRVYELALSEFAPILFPEQESRPARQTLLVRR